MPVYPGAPCITGNSSPMHFSGWESSAAILSEYLSFRGWSVAPKNPRCHQIIEDRRWHPRSDNVGISSGVVVRSECDLPLSLDLDVDDALVAMECNLGVCGLFNVCNSRRSERENYVIKRRGNRGSATFATCRIYRRFGTSVFRKSPQGLSERLACQRENAPT